VSVVVRVRMEAPGTAHTVIVTVLQDSMVTKTMLPKQWLDTIVTCNSIIN